MKRKGISLIALVIVIVIIIILAGAVILKLADKKPIQDPVKEAAVADVKADPEKYYGAYVNYVPSNGCQVKWRVFYADDANIYLIAEDYVPNNYLTETGLIKSIATRNLEGKLVNWKDYCVYSDIDRQDLVTKLTTSSYYTEFKDLDGKAANVVGAPTLEQFKTSYNAVNPDATKQMDILNCTEGQSVTGLDRDDKADADGYLLRFGNTGNYRYWQQMPSDANKRDLYIVTDDMNASGMWLCSFSANLPSYVMYAYHFDQMLQTEYNSECIGVRPLVKLNSNVKLVDPDEDGVYDLK